MSFNAAEKHQSQIPALQMLVALGFKPLSQARALAQRGDRLRNVVLDDVLADSIMRINRDCCNLDDFSGLVHCVISFAFSSRIH